MESGWNRPTESFPSLINMIRKERQCHTEPSLKQLHQESTDVITHAELRTVKSQRVEAQEKEREIKTMLCDASLPPGPEAKSEML